MDRLGITSGQGVSSTNPRIVQPSAPIQARTVENSSIAHRLYQFFEVRSDTNPEMALYPSRLSKGQVRSPKLKKEMAAICLISSKVFGCTGTSWPLRLQQILDKIQDRFNLQLENILQKQS